jgi:hypothetical protein
VKIQFGGLLGVQRLLDGESGEKVQNVDALAASAEQRFASLDAVPTAEIVKAIAAYKLRTRRGR